MVGSSDKDMLVNIEYNWVGMDEFKNTVWNYYHSNRRAMPWRDHIDPYHVVVSEIMLQQTQVPRVMVKFSDFITRFPTFETLAQAALGEVLTAWQGMGYNRRGKYLQQVAQIVTEEYGGMLPEDPAVLVRWPGIGPATAASIVCYVYDKPVVFIETNIRRVFIHHFFQDKQGVDDRDLWPLVAEAMDREHPRNWYYALMDYGTHLAKTVPNPNHRSRHHSTQSTFEGSRRQVRGALLRALSREKQGLTVRQLKKLIADERLGEVIETMEKEGLIRQENGRYVI